MPFPIIDLHCDLLWYLAHDKSRTPLDPLSRCSHSQLMAGGVMLQTLAIFTETGSDSVHVAEKQIASYRSLLKNYPKQFASFAGNSSNLIQVLPAIENSSGFALEDEPLDHCFERLQSWIDQIGPIVYLSLTWNGDNRFGGGAGSKNGLKNDGKQLLQWLDGKKIAIDLSHTSDRLASEIIESIDKYNLELSLIASHSNFRTIHAMERNLPDEIAKQIIQRKGLIGLNLFGPFISKNDSNAIARHIQHGLELNGQQSLCFGADFFCTEDAPDLLEKYPGQAPFFPNLANSSAYPYLIKLIRDRLSLDEQTLKNISSENNLRFLKANIHAHL